MEQYERIYVVSRIAYSECHTIKLMLRIGGVLSVNKDLPKTHLRRVVAVVATCSLCGLGEIW
jgi:hypothetical protein